MLARQVNRIVFARSSLTSVRCFSADEKAGAEWGVKYDDECLKFEKEWEEIAGKVESEQQVWLDNEMSEAQKKKVDLICDKVLDFNVFEMRYLALSMKTRMMKTSGINPLKLNMDWPSIKQDGAGTWPPANPNWFKQ